MTAKHIMSFLKRILLLVIVVVNFIFADDGNKPRKCIMVFGAHADDVEGMAGGTLAKYIAEGYRGIYVCVMNNLSGNQIEKVPGNWDFAARKLTAARTSSPKVYQVDALETMQTRKEEALGAANVFGAEPVFLDFCEPELWLGRKLIIYGTEEYINYDPPGRRHVSLGTRYSEDVNIVVALLKKYQPEITIIHTPGGEKLDHGESGYLMYLAFKKAMAQGIPVGQLWTAAHGWLSDAPAVESGRGKADVQIDIRKYHATKYQAWNKHRSQNGGDIEKSLGSRSPRYDRDVEKFITILDNTK